MKTIFDSVTRDGLIARIRTLNADSTAGWGKMNIFQMLRHCTVAEDMYLGKTEYPRAFLGRIIGKWALRNMLKDESPMSKNAPTSSAFIVTGQSGDIEQEKVKWITLLQEYAHYNRPGIKHWFFGDMSKEQVGQFVFKHADHHLRQFNS